MRSAGALVVIGAALVVAGCLPDQITWQDSGYVVGEVRRFLDEEYHADDAHVRCIRREVEGGVYECEGETAAAVFSCDVEIRPTTQKVKALECEREAREEDHAPGGGETTESHEG